MRVYRIEDSEGNGPWSNGTLFGIYKYRDGDNYPNPYQDGLSDFFNYEHSFGVPSIAMLKHWFGFSINKLKDHFVVEYEIEGTCAIISKSKKQVCFLKHRAYVVDKVLLSSILFSSPNKEN